MKGAVIRGSCIASTGKSILRVPGKQVTTMLKVTMIMMMAVMIATMVTMVMMMVASDMTAMKTTTCRIGDLMTNFAFQSLSSPNNTIFPIVFEIDYYL